MSFDAALSALIASLVGGVIVAGVNHWLTQRRDFRRKLTELRIEQLIDCWVKLERTALPPEGHGEERLRQIFQDADDAMARIKLLGTASEVALALTVEDKLTAGISPAVVDLLNELRVNLRRELELESVKPLRNFFFRFHRTQK